MYRIAFEIILRIILNNLDQKHNHFVYALNDDIKNLDVRVDINSVTSTQSMTEKHMY